MSYPHRVLRVRITITDEETGGLLASKVARVHETDIEAGRWMLEHKLGEAWKDISHFMPREKAS